jgi:diadenosine tetraphosphate (Ap4A) HIT family hydrolase
VRDNWEARLRGQGCTLCAPRPASTAEWDFVARLSISSLYLAKNQTYRGQCVLVFDPRHAPRPDDLSREEWAALSEDLRVAAVAVVSAVRPDHVNVASLGNAAPHLHWHVVPRTIGDPRWGSPIWTTDTREMRDTRLSPREQQNLVELLRDSVSRAKRP